MQSRNARLGLWFFGFYLLLYGGFVVLNAVWPESMDWSPSGGLNLAIVWGFALIIAAVLLALVYGAVCRSDGSADQAGDRQP